MNENETIKIIKQRRSIRQFLEKQVPENDLNIIIDAGLYAPNGGTNFEENIHFTIIQNKDILALPAKWWKGPCLNFPDGTGWRS